MAKKKSCAFDRPLPYAPRYHPYLCSFFPFGYCVLLLLLSGTGSNRIVPSVFFARIVRLSATLLPQITNEIVLVFMVVCIQNVCLAHHVQIATREQQVVTTILNH
jgi:hypothetical protein